MKANLLVVALLSFAGGGCVPSYSASEAKHIQDTKGFFTQSLYYIGSDRNYHHFEQMRGPGAPFQGWDRPLKVPVEQVQVPSSIYFEHSGSHVSRKVRIKGPPYIVKAR